MTVTVEAHGVRKEYGGFVALEDLSLAVEAGEILGVLGPNGAGKTTAIRILTTILAPTRGSFSVAGAPHTRQVEIRAGIGVLPESAGYPERQTGEEFLRFHARLYGRSRADAAVVSARLLAEVGLTDRARSLVATYSRGMRQRLGLARALVNDPTVVFLDEPTLGLDPEGQRSVLALVRGLARERGATVLLSTHLLSEVEDLCTRVLILNRGRLVAEGTVAEVARQAAAPRSARLRVPADRFEEACAVLATEAAIESVDHASGQPGSIELHFATAEGDPGSAALRTLWEAAVPVLAFELEGARLSDAFLAVTEGER